MSAQNWPGSSRYPPRSCEEPGCFNNTRESKPFCPDHVTSHPHVQAMMAKHVERDAEIEAVRQRGHRKVDPQGLTAQELMLHLRNNGMHTVERLAKELQLETDTLSDYVLALKKSGRVVMGKTPRGSITVRLKNC